MRNSFFTLFPIIMLSFFTSAGFTEEPKLVADFGGGNTQLRESEVNTAINALAGGLPSFVDSSGGLGSIADMRIRYKLYTLLGEPVVDALLYWELAASDTEQTLFYDSRFFDGLDAKAGRATGITFTGFRSISRSKLSRYSDLLKRFENIKPVAVTIRATIGIEGTALSSSSRLSLAGPETETGDPARSRRAQMDIDIDLPNTSGTWQRLSVPSSPDWEDLGSRVKEIFSLRLPGEDVVIYDAELTNIVWPDFEIHRIAGEYLSREIKEQETQLSDEDFFSRPPADSDDLAHRIAEREPTELEREAGLREYNIRRRSAQSRERADKLTDKDPGIDVTVKRRGNNNRNVTVSFDPKMEGLDVVFVNADGQETSQSGPLSDTRSFTVDSNIHLVRFYRNGELVAEFDRLRDPGYTTAVKSHIGSTESQWEKWSAGGFVAARYSHFPPETSFYRNEYSYDFIRSSGGNLVLFEDPDEVTISSQAAVLRRSFSLTDFDKITLRWRMDGPGLVRIGLITDENRSGDSRRPRFAPSSYLFTTYRENAEGKDRVDYIPMRTTLYTIIETNPTVRSLTISTYTDRNLTPASRISYTIHSTAIRNNRLFGDSFSFSPYIRFDHTEEGSELLIENMEIVQ